VEGWGESPMATIITARGCPFKCTFCQPAESIHFGKKVRRRSVDNVMGEIHELIEKYDPKFFVFYDDSFAYNKKWTKEFINKYDCKIPFLASARADFICNNVDLVEGLHEVGMKVMSVGFESGSDRILKMIKKGVTAAQNFESIGILGTAGVKIFANIMYGFPTETKAEQELTKYMCDYIKTFDSMISPAYFTPFPGTELGDKCTKEGNSLVDINNMTRFGRDKIKGIDYDFLDKFVWS
jgi:anaerobic magnesium-protoporphyrin IX monomethyl ester cyclase